MSADIEQYRPGFEAWATGPEGEWLESALTRAGNGEYIEPEVREQFKAWTAAKREASTEPRAKLHPKPCDVRQLVLDLCNIAVTFHGKSELEARISGAVNQFAGYPKVAGALPDEARDAALPPLPRLPRWLLDTIGEYGMARTDTVGQLEVQHRWEQLIAGIKKYASEYGRAAIEARAKARVTS